MLQLRRAMTHGVSASKRSGLGDRLLQMLQSGLEEFLKNKHMKQHIRLQTGEQIIYFIILLHFICVNAFCGFSLCVARKHVYAYHMCAWCQQSSEEHVALLELELQAGVNHPMGTRD